MTAVADPLAPQAPSSRRSSPLGWFAGLRIGAKILVVTGLAVVLTALVGLTGQFAVHDVKETGERIVNVTAAESQLNIRSRSNFSGFRRSVILAAVQPDAEAKADAVASAEENYTEVVDAMKELQTMPLSESDRATLTQEVLPALEDVWQVWTGTLQPVAADPDLTLRGLQGYLAQMDEVFDPPVQRFLDANTAITDSLAASMSAQVTESGDNATSATVRIWLITAAGAAVLFAIGVGIARLVSSSIGRLRQALVALSEGDLTATADASGRDEVGQMARALNEATHTLRSAMVQINGTSSTLSDSSRSLNAISSQISANADSTSNQASGLAGTAQEVSGSVQTVAAGTEEMEASIREIASSSAEAVRVASSAVNEAVTARATVAKLGDSSVEIGNVVKAITSIAEQTNLLALNATIEAARAGEAGKGFAVVAEEVKQLAQETARATEDISKRVEAIQADTQEAVDAIARISQTIEDVNAYQTTIASAVEEQTATTSEISRSITEAAAGSASIATSVDSVASAAQASSSSIQQAERASGELAGLSTELRQLVARFRL
ncbi:methyl-accepting chemotaxis protein [Kineosporia rhizophila]|uniref:methyl-accepting chemotaxis protein n=1 Tax=Kineosporia rhizophila TaxID=84633 RepID=UPI001E303D0A|nr:methyl-accepting chemotaxis protein [Kineosporia rhizophila]MCE0540014.1 methyl-accepting chemotaxis protein [Kineosporia rhizophila]